MSVQVRHFDRRTVRENINTHQSRVVNPLEAVWWQWLYLFFGCMTDAEFERFAKQTERRIME